MTETYRHPLVDDGLRSPEHNVLSCVFASVTDVPEVVTPMGGTCYGPLRSRAMDVLINLFVASHIIGIAALLGGWLTQLKSLGTGDVRIAPSMVHGALVMLVTGFILSGLNEADDVELNQTKLGVKGAILIVILVLVFIKRKEERIPKGYFAAIGLLTMTNVVIATTWT